MEEKKTTFNFIEEEWFTNRTYNDNCKDIPHKSGVYLLVYTKLETMDHEILYVGSSKDLKTRYDKHTTKRVLTQIYGDNVRFYFKEIENYIEEEKELISKIRPKFNVQWNLGG